MMRKNRLNNFKNLVNKPWKLIVCILISILLFNQIISLTIGTNFLFNGFTWLLNSLGVYTEEIPSITIKSDGWDSKKEGAWKVEKSARWTSASTAEILFNVDSIVKTNGHFKDVILILDTSTSMKGEKIKKIKQDTTELTKELLSNENNKLALIGFNAKSTIISELTNNEEEILEKINSLSLSEGTNYNAGLKNVDIILKNYKKESNRDVVILFLTDGAPNEETPNEIGTYEVLKNKYPYITINGIQYEMGTTYLEAIKRISDKQYLAYIDNLNNILLEASFESQSYEKFEVVDYINKDYFYINNKDNIEVSIGNATLEEENGLQKIVWTIDNETLKTGTNAHMKIGIILNNHFENVNGFYPTNDTETIKSKLLNEKEIIKTSNQTPVLTNMFEITYDTNPPVGCNIKSERKETHYIYENIIISTETPTCPGYIFKGWVPVNDDLNYVNDYTFIMPSNDVIIRATWTKQLISKSMNGTIHEKATFYNLIRNEAKVGSYAKEYTGLESDTYKNKVYYYNGKVANNNVLFGNFCWKMIRTTETGGVKMLYNGKPDTEGRCNNTGEDSILENKSSFGPTSSSIAYIGYMFNEIYSDKTRKFIVDEIINYETTIINTYWYADSYNYTNNYSLINPYQITNTTDYSSLVGKYTLQSDSKDATKTSIYYISKVVGDTIYCLELTEGKSLEYHNNQYTFGDSLNDNGNGTFTINNPITINKTDWLDNYNSLVNKYVCKNATSNTCSNPWYISETTNTLFKYTSVSDEFLYGNSFEYNTNTGEYMLIDTISFWNWKENYSQLNNFHYTCFETDGVCTRLNYIHYTDEPRAHYIRLTNGESVEDAIKKMTNVEDINTTDSSIKIAVETWFENNLIDYEKYLEDTIYCNDRRIITLGGWNPNGGNTTESLRFYSTKNLDFTCENKLDRFTKYTENGNGKLKYPVGLLTRSEAKLSGFDVIKSNVEYWSGSPSSYGRYNSNNYSIYLNGDTYSNGVDIKFGIRPMISLRPNMEYINGDGSTDNPYIVNLNE